MKLTIQHKWKIYTPWKYASQLEIIIEAYIKSGDLVEIQPQEEKTEETATNFLQVWEVTACWHCQPFKFWEWLKMAIAWGFDEKKCDCRCHKKDTQPEELSQEQHLEMYKHSVPYWTPIPWEMIEVSNDRENWYNRNFTEMINEYYFCKFKWDEIMYWNYARPLSQEPIEKLPEYEPSEPDWRDMQISMLTRWFNNLIEKINKPIER